jgi:ATP-dependent Lhr-like helicase
LAGFLRRKNPAITVLLPDDEPDRSRAARALARNLAQLAHRWQGRRSGLLIGEINDAPAREHPLAGFLEEAGFVATSLGFQMRRRVENAADA